MAVRLSASRTGRALLSQDLFISICSNNFLLSKNLKIRMYKTVILSVVLYGRETWSLSLSEEDRPRVLQNRENIWTEER
jgi:hypothetical protein